MPTATEYFGYDVINNGPLTTTFTAPTSCSTLSTGSPYVAMAANTTEIVAQLSCGTLQSLGDCHPSGSQLDSLRAAFATSPPQQGFIDYFSPGIACPAGWTTVGVAATVGGTLSVSGFFTENAYTALPSGIEYEALPFQSIFLKILGPSETLAFCCPR
ncbi:hypothetical protein BX600DRAFT_207053 [Xylariales sp. PMI_506]|nr:hypothetical protein BX600DRAFT_207053 [Xylariales sp. PMI_506]